MTDRVERIEKMAEGRVVEQIAQMEAENKKLRRLLNNGWLVVNEPANAFQCKKLWSEEVERTLGGIKGCMTPANAKNPLRSGLADAFGQEFSR